MLSLTDPALLAMLTAPPPVLADWLTDQGVSLPELLLLFAGTAPEYVDGVSQEALAEWLVANGERERGENVRKVTLPEPPQSLWLNVVSDSRLWRKVFSGYMMDLQANSVIVECKTCEEEHHRQFHWSGKTTTSFFGNPTRFHITPTTARTNDNRQLLRGDCPICRTLHWMLDHDRPEQRERKRQVLTLFPDVKCRNLPSSRRLSAQWLVPVESLCGKNSLVQVFDSNTPLVVPMLVTSGPISAGTRLISTEIGMTQALDNEEADAIALGPPDNSGYVRVQLLR